MLGVIVGMCGEFVGICLGMVIGIALNIQWTPDDE